MKTKITLILVTLFCSSCVYSYPGMVGLTGKAKNCLTCHVNNGEWDNGKTIIDIIDKESLKSFKQSDGSFEIEVSRHQPKTILFILGRQKNEPIPAPSRNAWLFIDPQLISDTTVLSKFAAGWDVNLQLGCRIPGDAVRGFEEAFITASPMTIKPLTDAKDVEIQLQAMMTRGESAKGKPKEGLISNYFESKILLKVID